jgi:uncharacterized protein YijF (DUF1287 family)
MVSSCEKALNIAILAMGLFLTSCSNYAVMTSAKNQIGQTVSYNPEYRYISYPMGDIEMTKGVCTDVIVRALRDVGMDLQQDIYEDKKENPQRYRDLYYTNKLDTNIDHRRVRNMRAYFISQDYRVDGDFESGDIVVWEPKDKEGEPIDHIGVCSNNFNNNGEPLMIHNSDSGVEEQDVLRAWKIVDHFRIFSDKSDEE